jgi:hypothetical protein
MCRKRRHSSKRRRPALLPMTRCPRNKRYRVAGSSFINRRQNFVWSLDL